MEKKIYKPIIENIIEILDKDINHLMEERVFKHKDYATMYGERNEYYNIITVHFLPIARLCKEFGWNNAYLFLLNKLEGFLNEFIEDYEYLKENWEGKKDPYKAHKLATLRFRFREFLRFELFEGLLKHLKEDAEIANIYGRYQLRYKKAGKVGVKYRFIMLSDIEDILNLNTIPYEAVNNSRNLLSSFLGIYVKEFRREYLNEYLNKYNVEYNDPTIFKHVLMLLLFLPTLEGNMLRYEVVPGEDWQDKYKLK